LEKSVKKKKTGKNSIGKKSERQGDFIDTKGEFRNAVTLGK
jgi:hypothetical protein